VGSVNVDLYQRMSPSSIKLAGKPVDVSPIKGMTLPAKSFVENKDIAAQLADAGFACSPGEEEAMLLKMDGPFEQKTGGKGANAAAAAGQTFGCEFVCHFGRESEAENKTLLADLREYGGVDTARSEVVAGPTGTAYILLFEGNDNAILLLGGANQSWPRGPIDAESSLHKAIAECVAVMLQREIPDHVNVEVARTARELGKPVFMDVGGTDAPLDEALLPHLSVIAPNESELTFISGVETCDAGVTSKVLVRRAVAALKGKFAAAGNPHVEVLVTLGSQGSMHFAPQWAECGVEDVMGLLQHETYMGCYALATEDGKPRDTTGAGDCFRGSYVAARYGEGKATADAMKWATAASSLAVETLGAMPSMPPPKAIAARARADMQDPGFTGTDAVDMKVTLRKPKGFYTQAALTFLRGVEAEPEAEGRAAVAAKPAVSALRISGLGDACAAAAAAATQVEAAGAGTICSVRTAYPSAGRGTGCPQIIIDVRRS